MTPGSQDLTMLRECSQDGPLPMLTIRQGCCSATEIDTGHSLSALTFSLCGEFLLSGGAEGVQLWRIKDGKRQVPDRKWLAVDRPRIGCLAILKDGKWVATGIGWSRVDEDTYRQVFSFWEDDSDLTGLDFSPDLSRLVTTSDNCTATVWDVATHEPMLTLHHKQGVKKAKFSPQGDRIATLTWESVRIYDSNNGQLIIDIPVKIVAGVCPDVLWSNDYIFVTSTSKIRKIDPSTGSTHSEWKVPESNSLPCIALPKHERFLAYAANRAVTFWDVSTQSQLGSVHYPQEICSITFSPDDRSLAIGGKEGKICVKYLTGICEPDIQIDDTVFKLWKNSQHTEAEVLLTDAISESPCHHLFVNRALIQTRLQQWDGAIRDVEQSLKVHPSIIGYVTMSIALVGKGEKHKGYRLCDIAFQHVHSSHVNFLLLIKAIIIFMAGDHDDAISRLDDLIATVPFNSLCYAVQAQMYFLLANSYMASGEHGSSIPLLEQARVRVRHYGGQIPSLISLICGWKFDDLSITIQQCFCEALQAEGRTKQAGVALLEMVDAFGQYVYVNKERTEWVSGFTQRCLVTLQSDKGVSTHDEMPLSEVSVDSQSYIMLLKEWAKATLSHGSWKDTLSAAVGFPRFATYRAICEYLEMTDHETDASECFRQMVDEMAGQECHNHAEADWAFSRLENLGDIAVNAGRNDDAIFQYSAALTLKVIPPQTLLVKRSKVYHNQGSWEDALSDANRLIALDPSSPWGYERKHAALHGIGDYENAIHAFETMLSKIVQPAVCEPNHEYVNPEETKTEIHNMIQNVTRESPPVLINTVSGCLLNKLEQIAAFETLPVFKELISSMTTCIDVTRIKREVTEYYRYAMFSHKWEGIEPLFDKVISTAVYDLDESLTHDKLRMFCRTVRDAGLNWAWSDTCCINKADHFVLQEALVSMFKWYQGSATTIIFLRGVNSLSRPGALVRSIWNSRAWTFQEYHASKEVRFYTEDWMPYMNLDVPNHKESSMIISEMEQATGVSAKALTGLRPGLGDIREKLYLASKRQTTLIEDAAYSLFGIFSVSLPIVYGEGDRALGRLLAQLLANSGDTRILAWTGKSGGFNSCLPASITVFDEPPLSYIPSVVEDAQMDAFAVGLNGSPLDLTLAMELYDRVSELPVASFSGQRMKLPCIAFKVGPVSASQDQSGGVFRAQTTALGIVEIATKEDLSQLGPLHLVYPWIDFLLDRQPIGQMAQTLFEESTSKSSSTRKARSSSISSTLTSAISQTRTALAVARRPFQRARAATYSAGETTSLLPPSTISLTDKRQRAVQLVARLRQPFGALLLARNLGGVAAFGRVVTEKLITVQVKEPTPAVLNKLADGVCVLDVL